MAKEKLSNAQKTARKMVGDGKLPNKYWVSISDQFMTNKLHKDEPENNVSDWSGEVYKDIPEAYEIYGPFDTFTAAENKMNSLANECSSPEDSAKFPNQKNFHSVEIEDRLSGQIYNGQWNEHWYPKEYRGEKIMHVTFRWEWDRDTKFTEETMAKRGATFE